MVDRSTLLARGGLGDLIGSGENMRHSPVGSSNEREIRGLHAIRVVREQSIPRHCGDLHEGAFALGSPHEVALTPVRALRVLVMDR